MVGLTFMSFDVWLTRGKLEVFAGSSTEPADRLAAFTESSPPLVGQLQMTAFDQVTLRWTTAASPLSGALRAFAKSQPCRGGSKRTGVRHPDTDLRWP